jgi:ketosteroid isomerase-like protein
MRANKETETQIMAVLKKLGKAYESRDEDELLALMVPDPDLVLLGTGADEKRIGQAEALAQAKRDWAQSETSSLEIGWHLVSSAGRVAWVTADMAFRLNAGGQQMTLPGRLTAVLEQRDGKWLIAQSHFSLPTAGQDESQSFPT